MTKHCHLEKVSVIASLDSHRPQLSSDILVLIKRATYLNKTFCLPQNCV